MGRHQMKKHLLSLCVYVLTSTLVLLTSSILTANPVHAGIHIVYIKSSESISPGSNLYITVTSTYRKTVSCFGEVETYETTYPLSSQKLGAGRSISWRFQPGENDYGTSTIRVKCGSTESRRYVSIGSNASTDVQESNSTVVAEQRANRRYPTTDQFDNKFLSSLSGYVPNPNSYGYGDTVVTILKLACSGMDDGLLFANTDRIFTDVMTSTSLPWTTGNAQFVLAAGVYIYCPQHKAEMESYYGIEHDDGFTT